MVLLTSGSMYGTMKLSQTYTGVVTINRNCN